MLYLKMDVLQLADVFENFVEKSTLMYGINRLYIYSGPGYTWKAGLKLTNIKLDFIHSKELLLLLENNIRGGISSVMVIVTCNLKKINKSYISMQKFYMDGL